MSHVISPGGVNWSQHCVVTGFPARQPGDLERDPWLCGPASRPGCLCRSNEGQPRWPGAGCVGHRDCSSVFA